MCSPSKTNPKITRRAFLLTSVLSVASSAATVSPALASRRGLPPGIAETVLSTNKYPPEPPFAPSDFARFDRSPDRIFYSEPRFTRHIDSNAVTALRTYISTSLLPNTTDLLDLCASIESYIPTPSPLSLRVSGLGMNLDEMLANPVLSSTLVHDLNLDPTLPYKSASFDAVLCALSMDYLTQPFKVAREIARVLRPGGTVAIAFSDRVFSSKAVAMWTSSGDVDHIYMVGAYLHYADAFHDICTVDLSPRRFGACTGDPLYMVTARRS